MKKALLILLSVIVVAVVALTIIIKVYITPEKVKGLLLPRVEKALGRKVTVGEISIGILKGIEVRDFTIKEADGKTDFLKSGEFVLKYSLLPLLSKRVVINELRIISPEIRIVRDKDGKYNFESIGRSEETGEVKKKTGAAEPEGLPVSLLVSSIVLKDSSFTLIDDKGELPDIKGVINLDTGITGTGNNKLSSKGKLEIRLDEIKTRKPDKLIRDISADLKYEVSIDLESGSLRLHKADILFQEIPFSLTGDVNYKTTTEIDITLLIPETKTADILKSVSPFVDTAGITLSGGLSADLKVRGNPGKVDSLRTTGEIRLVKVGGTINNVSAILDGNLKFTEESIDIDMNGTVGENTAAINGSVKSYLKDQKINLNLYSKKLILDELIPATGEKTAAPVQEPGPANKNAGTEEAKPLDLKITADGKVTIDSAIYKGMEMNNFNMIYLFKNNRLEIKDISATAGKGRLNLKSLIDLSIPGYAYNLSSSIDSLHADEVVNSFFPEAKDTVFGILSLNLDLNGAGTLPDNVKKNLVGNGDFNISNGKITNSKITDTLSTFLGIEELRTIDITEAKGTVTIKNGTAKLQSIFSSEDLSMDPSGSIGLDETLDLAFDLKLSPRLTDKVMLNSGISSYIKDEEEWGTIPLKVSGTFSAPSFSIDAAKAGKRVIEKKAGKLLEDILNKDKDKTEKSEEEKDSGNQLEDVLKKLF